MHILLMFGSGAYRGLFNGVTVESNLSLAWMPIDASGPHVGNIQFWNASGGTGASGPGTWQVTQSLATGLFTNPAAELWDLGEISVFWDSVFSRWIAFFNTGQVAGGGCAYYSSPWPWGP
ncbi:MAG: hypothetical protein ABSE49_05875 [Polyangiaceae bacterium]|jgi:hypothetical protein